MIFFWIPHNSFCYNREYVCSLGIGNQGNQSCTMLSKLKLSKSGRIPPISGTPKLGFVWCCLKWNSWRSTALLMKLARKFWRCCKCILGHTTSSMESPGRSSPTIFWDEKMKTTCFSRSGPNLILYVKNTFEVHKSPPSLVPWIQS